MDQDNFVIFRFELRLFKLECWEILFHMGDGFHEVHSGYKWMFLCGGTNLGKKIRGQVILGGKKGQPMWDIQGMADQFYRMALKVGTKFEGQTGYGQWALT